MVFGDYNFLLSIYTRQFFASVTFYFQSRNLNALRRTEAGLIMGGDRSLSHVKDEETRSSFLSLPHTLT